MDWECSTKVVLSYTTTLHRECFTKKPMFINFGVRNVSFSEDFVYVLNEWSPEKWQLYFKALFYFNRLLSASSVASSTLFLCRFWKNFDFQNFQECLFNFLPVFHTNLFLVWVCRYTIHGHFFTRKTFLFNYGYSLLLRAEFIYLGFFVFFYIFLNNFWEFFCKIFLPFLLKRILCIK